MKYIAILLLFTIFSCSNHNHKLQNETKRNQQIDTVKYSYSVFNHGKRLFLLSDGSFMNEVYTFSCSGSGFHKKVSGTYKIDSISLSLFPQKIALTTYSFDRKVKPTKVQLDYGVDSLKIKTEFKIIHWETKTYLLSETYDYDYSEDEENDFMRFADYVNIGFEPKTSGMYLSHKEKDTFTSAFDMQQIPEKWQKYFLKKPIVTKIKNLKKVYDSEDSTYFFWEIELDKGKNDGMTKRLSFTTKDDMISLDIDSITNNSSFGKHFDPDFITKDYPIGTELRTKWE
ncbi:hypothetical protein U8527_08010 [Kordia algicida OT-1]|uniref:Uncharacterized protein n=1 Tax=Kordia algicida OT-1 TaxID=391587 RepID=A9E922_9FLAO|nr:hypothetical protein [Kordia algicida]EDP94848.1 hypothetical protein KAOT1_01440 [Kordia algicida OT-1]